MSNSFRHFLGVIAGLAIPPVLTGLLVFGVDGLTAIGKTVKPADADTIELYTRIGLLIVSGVMIALMTGSRLSPLASLISGLVFTAAGVLWIGFPNRSAELISDVPIAGKDEALRTLVYHGMFLLIGVTLLASSFPPSRWRAQARNGSGSASPRPYESERMGPQPDEAEVTFTSPDEVPAKNTRRSAYDVPGYRFLPRRERGQNYSPPRSDGTTQELPRRGSYD